MPFAAHIALIDPEFYCNLSPSMTASVSYSGQFGDNVSDNAVEAHLTWKQGWTYVRHAPSVPLGGA